MVSGHFYFIEEQYFKDFPDPYLMKNHEVVDGKVHDRPCIFAFVDNTGLYWAIPVSSQVGKYKYEYQKKLKKYKKCDTIDFGFVLGKEKAFLMQNMCPITEKYIINEYLNNGAPVMIDNITRKRIISKAKKVLRLQRKGTELIFPDVLKIERQLLHNESSEDISE